MTDAPYLTPPDVARQLAVKPSKVLSWIAAGELLAINVAERPGGRPRWRISQAALAAFLSARSARPPVPVVRRRRQAVAHMEWF